MAVPLEHWHAGEYGAARAAEVSSSRTADRESDWFVSELAVERVAWESRGRDSVCSTVVAVLVGIVTSGPCER